MQYVNLLLITLFLFTSSNVYSEVYITTDENGVVSYSDSPSKNAKQVKIIEKTTILEVEKTQTKTNLLPKIIKKEIIKQSIKVTQPINDSTVRNNNGIVNISVSVLPELQDTDTIQVYLDGELQTQQAQTTSFTLLDVFRGTHTIHTVLVNNKGTIIAKSNKITIHMHRNRQNQINN